MPNKDRQDEATDGRAPSEVADRESVIAEILEGLADAAAGRTKPARAVLKRLACKYGFKLPTRRGQRD